MSKKVRPGKRLAEIYLHYYKSNNIVDPGWCTGISDQDPAQYSRLRLYVEKHYIIGLQCVNFCLETTVRVMVWVLAEVNRIRIMSTTVGLWHPLYLDTMPVTRARVKVRVLTEARNIRTTSRARVVARGCSRKEATTWAIFSISHTQKLERE